jgi:hypothetical protein
MPGFCELGVSWQSLENPHMKAALSMPKGLTGVYITKTEPMFEASRILKQGDVLCSFNGACVCLCVLVRVCVCVLGGDLRVAVVAWACCAGTRQCSSGSGSCNMPMTVEHCRGQHSMPAMTCTHRRLLRLRLLSS